MRISKLAEIAVGVIIVIFLVFALYVLLVWFPVTLYAESDCLKKGYPNERVTILLERFCQNLDGSVTVKVDRQ